ncbi:hypothetical protein GCM10008924_08670 [Gracilibacillus halotolerans]
MDCDDDGGKDGDAGGDGDAGDDGGVDGDNGDVGSRIRTKAHQSQDLQTTVVLQIHFQ